MNIIIVSIHVTVAVILVLTVLLQAGKGAGMGAAFGGSSGTVFGTRGPATLISKITCVAAVVFMITSLNLALSQSGGVKKGSIMDDYQSPAPISSPAAPAVTEESQAPAAAAPDAAVGNEGAAAPLEETSTPAAEAPVSDGEAALGANDSSENTASGQGAAE